MDLWLATSNPGKLKELKSLLMSFPFTIHSQKELSYFSPPPETGDSYLANARIKAKALHAVKNSEWVLAEDSGIEVEGLNNLPGIHSARYAGDHARDNENVAKLLKMLSLRSPANRNAAFRCVLVAYSPSGEEQVFEGQLTGTISSKVRGQTGFGYDPIFVPSGSDKTLAELGDAEKNKISHRAQAVRKWSAQFGG